MGRKLVLVILAVLFAAGISLAQNVKRGPGSGFVPSYTGTAGGTLPSTCLASQDVAIVTDDDAAGDCGGGTPGAAISMCVCNSAGNGWITGGGDAGVSGHPVSDATSLLTDNITPTKILNFQLEDLSVGTKTITVVDRDIKLDELPDDSIWDIRDYGAIPDDGLDDTPAIQAAIDACDSEASARFPDSNGQDFNFFAIGKVYFPTGRFELDTPPDYKRCIPTYSLLHEPGYITPEAFGAEVNDGASDATAFQAMFDHCGKAQYRVSGDNFADGIQEPSEIKLRKGTYEIDAERDWKGCNIMRGEKGTTIRWTGAAGGDVFNCVFEDHSGGIPVGGDCPSNMRIYDVSFDSATNYPDTHIDFEMTAGTQEDVAGTGTKDAPVDWDLTFERVAFKETQGPALNISTGTVNMDMRDKVRFDDVDTGIRLVLKSTQNGWRSHFEGGTIHGFSTFLQVDNYEAKGKEVITVEGMRVEAIDKGAQTGARQCEFIKVNHLECTPVECAAGGGVPENIILNLRDISSQFSTSCTGWAIVELDDQHAGATEMPINVKAEQVYLNGPLLGGEVDTDQNIAQLVTDDAKRYQDWIVVDDSAAHEGRTKSLFHIDGTLIQEDGDFYPDKLVVDSGTDPAATCTVGEIYVDTDGSTTSTTCTGGSAGVARLCVCGATDTWTGL